MKAAAVAVLTVLLTRVGSSSASDSDWGNQPWLACITAEEFDRTGLNKLTSEEPDYLAGFTVGSPVVDYSHSAQQCLLREGWEIIDPGGDLVDYWIEEEL